MDAKGILFLIATLCSSTTASELQSLQACPAIEVPCASYSWVDRIIAPANEPYLREYLRILGHVSLHAHYDSQFGFLDRVDKNLGGNQLPVCLCLSPYGPSIEPDNWTDPETKKFYAKRPAWGVDKSTVEAVKSQGELLGKWSKRLQGRSVTLLIDFERWNLAAEGDARSVEALRDRWSMFLNQVAVAFPNAQMVIYGWGDFWFQVSQNTATAIFGYWKPTQYWPADLQTRSKPGPACYYGATAEGRGWTSLRLARVRAAGFPEPWAHVQLVGQWPIGGKFLRGVVWSEADMRALGATLRAANAHPVFWGDVGSAVFDAQLLNFVRGFNEGGGTK